MFFLSTSKYGKTDLRRKFELRRKLIFKMSKLPPNLSRTFERFFFEMNHCFMVRFAFLFATIFDFVLLLVPIHLICFNFCFHASQNFLGDFLHK